MLNAGNTIDDILEDIALMFANASMWIAIPVLEDDVYSLSGDDGSDGGFGSDMCI